jgi:hypothetical protein
MVGIDLGAIFGSESAFGQILQYGVMQQVISALLGPALEVATQDINAANPVAVISPPDLADLVVRSYLDLAAAAATAAKSGVSPEDFALLVKAAGDAPDTTTLMEAYRRKIIPLTGTGPDAVTVEQGLREGRLGNKWNAMIEALGVLPIGVADAVDAVVENQIPFEEGQEYAYQNGLDPDAFQILVNTRGNPPSPTELADMVRRGIIPLQGKGPDVLSFEQGISEGATKDKWIPAYEQAMTVLPPESVIQDWLKEGVIDTADAVARFQLLGYDQTSAENYAAEAVATAVSQYRQLTESDVVALYSGRAIDAPTATSMLNTLGYSDDIAAEILAVTDFHVEVGVRNAAIAKIQTYYLARKITDTEVVTNLDALGVPPTQRQELVSAWQTERDSNVKLLTEAQIVDAWEYQIMDADTAVSQLEALGYTPYDAWVVLSVKNKGPVGPAPAQGPGATG